MVNKPARLCQYLDSSGQDDRHCQLTPSKSKVRISKRVLCICEHATDISCDSAYTATTFLAIEGGVVGRGRGCGRAFRVDVKRVPNTEGTVETAVRTLHFESSPPARSSSHNTTQPSSDLRPGRTSTPESLVGVFPRPRRLKV